MELSSEMEDDVKLTRSTIERFLMKQSPEFMQLIFSEATSCYCIFRCSLSVFNFCGLPDSVSWARLLPPLAQQIILRCLFYVKELTVDELNGWVNESCKEYEATCQ